MYNPRRFRRRGRHGGRGDPFVLVLLLQLAARVQRLDRKPPVTVALMIGLAALHFGGMAPPARHVCLQPYAVVADGDLFRLLGSAFVHASDWHIYYNLSSLLWKGLQLEFAAGSTRFAATVAHSFLPLRTMRGSYGREGQMRMPMR